MSVINKLKVLFQLWRGYFPSPLPQGRSEFESWSQSIIDIYKPSADDLSIKFALATMLLHLEPSQSDVPKRYFAKRLRKAAAAQVGATLLHEIKENQRIDLEKRQKEAIELKQQQDQTSNASNESILQN